MHKVHSFCNIKCHLMTLFVSYVGHRFTFFMENFKESSSMTKLCHNYRLSLISCCPHEKYKIWMTYMCECFYLPLILETQFSIFDQTLNFELLYCNISELILSLVHYCSCSLSNSLLIHQRFKINF